jgi:small subunit ribosomal protein S20
LANIKSAKKRAKQSEVHRQRNASQRSAMRTQVKNLEKVISLGDAKAANDVFRLTASVLDKAARKGLIHKNTAARKKSRLNKRIKLLSTKTA